MNKRPVSSPKNIELKTVETIGDFSVGKEIVIMGILIILAMIEEFVK